MDLSSLHEEKGGNTSKDKDRLHGGYNYLFRPKWFFAVDSTAERDPVASIDHRISLNPSIGYDFWNDDLRTLNFQSGVGYATESVAGSTDSTVFVDWRLDYTQKLVDSNLELFHKHHIYRNISGRKNIVLNSSTGFRVAITEDLYVNAQLNYDYDTEPAGGKESDDLTILIGAGLNF